jgi:hypothetical protein
MSVASFTPDDRRRRPLAVAVLVVVVGVMAAVVAWGTRITPVANAAAPVGQGFTITSSDLRFILRQIKYA